MKIRSAASFIILVLWSWQTAHASFVNGADDKRKIYKTGEPPPLMSDRKQELVPEAIPRRVRYVFADDATVNSAAALLRSRLESCDTALFKDSILVLPGAFQLLKVQCGLDDEPKISAIVPSKKEKDPSERDLTMGLSKKRSSVHRSAKRSRDF